MRHSARRGITKLVLIKLDLFVFFSTRSFLYIFHPVGDGRFYYTVGRSRTPPLPGGNGATARGGRGVGGEVQARRWRNSGSARAMHTVRLPRGWRTDGRRGFRGGEGMGPGRVCARSALIGAMVAPRAARHLAATRAKAQYGPTPVIRARTHNHCSGSPHRPFYYLNTHTRIKQCERTRETHMILRIYLVYHVCRAVRGRAANSRTEEVTSPPRQTDHGDYGNTGIFVQLPQNTTDTSPAHHTGRKRVKPRDETMNIRRRGIFLVFESNRPSIIIIT